MYGSSDSTKNYNNIIKCKQTIHEYDGNITGLLTSTREGYVDPNKWFLRNPKGFSKRLLENMFKINSMGIFGNLKFQNTHRLGNALVKQMYRDPNDTIRQADFKTVIKIDPEGNFNYVSQFQFGTEDGNPPPDRPPKQANEISNTVIYPLVGLAGTFDSNNNSQVPFPHTLPRVFLRNICCCAGSGIQTSHRLTKKGRYFES